MPKPGQRAEMARLKRQRLADVGERRRIIVDEEIDRRALVPGLGEVRLDHDDLVEHVERVRVVLLLDRLELAHDISRSAVALPERLKPLRISCLDPLPRRRVGILGELGEKLVERQLGDDLLGESVGGLSAISARAGETATRAAKASAGKKPAHDRKARALRRPRQNTIACAEKPGSALAGLVALLRLVDDVDAALAADQAVVAMAGA